MTKIDPVKLTQELVRFDTINPPGNEEDCARFLGGLLAEGGLEVDYYSFAEARTSLVARLPGSGDEPPLALTGHLDTVPLGAQPWSVAPLGGEIAEGRLYGRGASDMKSGLAAIAAAALALAGGPRPQRGLLLVLTAGEETGCDGARHLAGLSDALGPASALIVAEPTANYPAVGHKGALWLSARTTGVTAHGSMPERGVNAIYRAARAITKLEDFGFNQRPDALLGAPSLNVGTVHGGLNVNSVPDLVEVQVDIRSVPGQDHERILEQLRGYLGEEVEIEPFVDVEAVRTAAGERFVGCVFEVMAELLDQRVEARAMTYFTDASVLAPALSAPTVILGPGEPSLAHQTDEYCRVERIGEAAAAYIEIAGRWCGF